MIPVDFIFAMDQAVAGEPGYETLAANFIAQSDALMRGVRDIEVKCDEDDDEIVAHRVCLGNRPSSSIVMDQLDAFHIGQLAALYEHRTFVQGVCWNINPFDQMGVELGKQLAGDIRNALHGKADYEHDSSTTGLVAILASLFRRGQ